MSASWTRLRRRLRRDDGTAVIEFVVLVVLVLVPVVYVVLAATRVQAASYAVTQAAREAGRAFVQADSPGEAASAARAAVRLAMNDQGFDGANLEVHCSDACLAPGSRVQVRVSARVRLPFLPDGIDSVASVPVTADHVVPVDDYRNSP